MSSGKSLIGAGFVFIFSCLMAYVLNMSIGTAMDKFIEMFINYELYRPGPEWETTHFVDRIANLFYLIIYGLPIFGLGQFIYTAVRRQKYEQYNYQYEGQQ